MLCIASAALTPSVHHAYAAPPCPFPHPDHCRPRIPYLHTHDHTPFTKLRRTPLGAALLCCRACLRGDSRYGGQVAFIAAALLLPGRVGGRGVCAPVARGPCTRIQMLRGMAWTQKQASLAGRPCQACLHLLLLPASPLRAFAATHGLLTAPADQMQPSVLLSPSSAIQNQCQEAPSSMGICCRHSHCALLLVAGLALLLLRFLPTRLSVADVLAATSEQQRGPLLSTPSLPLPFPSRLPRPALLLQGI